MSGLDPEKERILELLQQRKTRWQSRLSNAGHSYALQTASRHMSQLACRDYYNAGLPALVWLKNLLLGIEQDPSQLDHLLNDLQALHARVLVRKLYRGKHDRSTRRGCPA